MATSPRPDRTRPEETAASAVSELDLKKLGRVIAMVGSNHEGEALTALRLADRMLRDAGMRWEDLLSPAHELEIATEAAAVLLAENTALKAELKQLHEREKIRADDLERVTAALTRSLTARSRISEDSVTWTRLGKKRVRVLRLEWLTLLPD